MKIDLQDANARAHIAAEKIVAKLGGRVPPELAGNLTKAISSEVFITLQEYANGTPIAD